MIEINKIYNEDCLVGMQAIESESVDVILTDPPYLYLKNQKLDRPFDEQKFFNEAKRVLNKDGFIVLFGRGTSFYRWNCILSDLGFKFKEEVIWNKRRCTIPAIPLHRIHETISIHTKGNGKIQKVYVDYLEKKQFDIKSIIQDINRIKSALNSRELDDLIFFLETGQIKYSNSKFKNFFNHALTNRSRATATFKSITTGLTENSIIEQIGDHYNTIHPTQKPVRLLERLLALVSKEGYLVLDPFSGSGSTAIASINSGRKYIGFEIDKEYFDLSIERVKKETSQTKINYGKV